MEGLIEGAGLMEKAWDEATCATFHCIRFTVVQRLKLEISVTLQLRLSFPNAETIRSSISEDPKRQKNLCVRLRFRLSGASVRRRAPR